MARHCFNGFLLALISFIAFTTFFISSAIAGTFGVCVGERRGETKIKRLALSESDCRQREIFISAGGEAPSYFTYLNRVTNRTGVNQRDSTIYYNVYCDLNDTLVGGGCAVQSPSYVLFDAATYQQTLSWRCDYRCIPLEGESQCEDVSFDVSALCLKADN